MSIMNNQTVYVPVNLKEKLHSAVYVSGNSDSKLRIALWDNSEKKFIPIEELSLEEKWQNSIILSEEELLELKKKWCNEAFDKGEIEGWRSKDTVGNLNEYLKNNTRQSKSDYINSITIE